jgi:hypothetical protein
MFAYLQKKGKDKLVKEGRDVVKIKEKLFFKSRGFVFEWVCIYCLLISLYANNKSYK